MRRRFTPEQANRTLPLVKRIVAEILVKGRELRALTRGPDAPGLRERMGVLDAEVRDLMVELSGIGCAYKDFDFELGLVDFPGEIDGKPVLLCWRSDEDEVRWYHAPDAGFAGRTPIPSHLLA